METNRFQPDATILRWVQKCRSVFEEGLRLSKPPARKSTPPTDPHAPTILLFSPHPDDETITGLLALRLKWEAGWRVVNVPVTYGRHLHRREARKKELQEACARLGFEILPLTEDGLEYPNIQDRETHPQEWQHGVRLIAEALRQVHPTVIQFPHADDFHPAHRGVHAMVMDALKSMPGEWTCYTVESEFWTPIDQPNLLVEATEEHLAWIIEGVLCHEGEVARNPYHARLPAWMADNVRRGSEVVGGAGAAAVPFAFGVVYRIRRWRNGKWEEVTLENRFVRAQESVARIFPPLNR